ncbi:hypothetical protein H4Q26_009701 [Puccinia striiformis f. sp. tritici PST-130]|nr:hypothetical protein H4Q26_009701 [Puccinia striiformis f. sp. tritici PST-130]
MLSTIDKISTYPYSLGLNWPNFLKPTLTSRITTSALLNVRLTFFSPQNAARILQGPLNSNGNDYEIRISYLEEIVRFLLARKEPGPLPSVSSASLGGSFRYSIDRGLVPLLSKTTAQSLIITRSSHRNLKKPFNITQTASSTKPTAPCYLPLNLTTNHPGPPQEHHQQPIARDTVSPRPTLK